MTNPTPTEKDVAKIAGADRELIYQALRFYFWAAGEGISPNASEDCLEPEEGFWQYSLRTDDEHWETVAERHLISTPNMPKGERADG